MITVSRLIGITVGRTAKVTLNLGLAAAIAIAGCSREPNSAVDAGAGEEQAAIVDVAVAQPSTARDARTYTGSTVPRQQVSLKSQTEGRLVSLAVDVGDPVAAGQTLAQIDAALLEADAGQANAELAARQFEVAQARTELADTRTLVAQAEAEYQQAQADAARLQTLASRGAISAQEAQRSQTTLQTALQALRSAQEQVRTRQQAIATVEQRVEAQRALLAQSQRRVNDTALTAPLSGVVLQRLVEPGDFLQPGQAVLAIGDFSEVEVQIQVSDRDRSSFRLGQSVQVQLDAFPGRRLTGRVSRISPVADPASRLIPIEITLPNPEGDIGSGLLARVTVTAGAAQTVVVPESALEIEQAASEPASAAQTGGQTPAGQAAAAGSGPNSGATAEPPERTTLFVVAMVGEQPQVEPRTVRLGNRANGQVEILEGLQPGEAYVLRSSQPLQPGQTVERSLLSES